MTNLHRLAISLPLLLAAALVPSHPFTRAATPAPESARAARPIDFNRDIRPILSDNCYACHGPDKNKRKADLRLDTKAGLFSTIEDRTTVVPNHPEKSELFRRLVTDDKDERMPDPKSNKRLSAKQIALIQRWIEEGAAWKGHWAYLKPTRRNSLLRQTLQQLKIQSTSSSSRPLRNSTWSLPRRPIPSR